MAARDRAGRHSRHIMPTIHVIGGCRGSLLVMMRGDRTLTGRAARHDIRSPCSARERRIKQSNHEQADACGDRTAPSLTRGMHGAHDPIIAVRHYSVTRHSLQARQKMACHAIVSDGDYWVMCSMHTARQTRRRTISASICLLMVALLYAPFAGAAWASYVMACCTSGQCPIAAHHHHKAPPAAANHMDCGHDMPGMTTCVISCCHDSEHSLFTSMAFVLPPPVAAANIATINSPIELAKPLDFPRSIEPLSPPPRFVSAAI